MIEAIRDRFPFLLTMYRPVALHCNLAYKALACNILLFLIISPLASALRSSTLCNCRNVGNRLKKNSDVHK